MNEQYIKEFGSSEPFMKRVPDRWISSCVIGWSGTWLEKILELDKKISEIAPNYVLHQVKEKFHELRYYIDFDSVPEDSRESVNKIISEYENDSFTWTE